MSLRINTFLIGMVILPLFTWSQELYEPIESQSQVWDDTLGEWVPESRTLLVEYIPYFLSVKIRQAWDRSQEKWINQKKLTEYHPEAKSDKITTEERWDSNKAEWIYVTRDSSFYNEQELWVLHIQETWDSTRGEWGYVWKNTRSYDEEYRLIQLLTEAWDPIQEQWVNSRKSTYTRDEHPDFPQITREIWDSALGDWVYEMRYVRTYDDQNRLTLNRFVSWISYPEEKSNEEEHRIIYAGDHMESERWIKNDFESMSFDTTWIQYNSSGCISSEVHKSEGMFQSLRGDSTTYEHFSSNCQDYMYHRYWKSSFLDPFPYEYLGSIKVQRRYDPSGQLIYELNAHSRDKGETWKSWEERTHSYDPLSQTEFVYTLDTLRNFQAWDTTQHTFSQEPKREIRWEQASPEEEPRPIYETLRAYDSKGRRIEYFYTDNWLDVCRNWGNMSFIGNHYDDAGRMTREIRRATRNSCMDGELTQFEFSQGEHRWVYHTYFGQRTDTITHTGIYLTPEREVRSGWRIVNTYGELSTSQRPKVPDPVFSIFPNPAHKKAWIKMRVLPSQGGKMELLDLTGKVVKTLNPSIKLFSTADLPAGVYFLRYTSQGQTYIQKLRIHH